VVIILWTKSPAWRGPEGPVPRLRESADATSRGVYFTVTVGLRLCSGLHRDLRRAPLVRQDSSG